MNRFVKVAEVSEFSATHPKRIIIENTELALFLIDGKYYAVQNECPHQHYSALHEGILNGLEITCPMHGWAFDVSTGRAIVGGGRLKCYAVRTEGNDIMVEAPNPDPDWATK